MRVCIRKSDNLLIGAQSNDNAPLETLISNALTEHGLTPDEVEAKVVTEAEYKTLLAAKISATEPYSEKRRKAYGSVQDQLDMLYWDQVNGTTKWKDHVSSVKSQYPKA